MDEAAPHLQFRCDTVLGSLHLRLEFELRREWTTVFGASGSGKSTLLRLIAGLVSKASPVVMVHGVDVSRVSAHRRGIGFVTQPPALFPHLSALQNICFGRLPRNGNAKDHLQRLLERFRLQDLCDKRVPMLSGGETQRVAIARALYPMPRLLLIDESFSGLDRSVRSELIETLRAIQSECAHSAPMPIVAVTHDVSEVFETADEVLRIDAGSIVAQGAPMEVLAEERQTLLAQLKHTPGAGFL